MRLPGVHEGEASVELNAWQAMGIALLVSIVVAFLLARWLRFRVRWEVKLTKGVERYLREWAFLHAMEDDEPLEAAAPIFERLAVIWETLDDDERRTVEAFLNGAEWTPQGD